MSRLVKEKQATRFARVPASKSKGGKMLKQFSEVVRQKLEEYTNAECEPVLDSDETSEETPKLEEYTNAECEPVLDSDETSEETILLTNGMDGDAFTEDLETVLNKSKRGKILKGKAQRESTAPRIWGENIVRARNWHTAEPVRNYSGTSEETILLTNGMDGDAFTENLDTVRDSMEVKATRFARDPAPKIKRENILKGKAQRQNTALRNWGVKMVRARNLHTGEPVLDSGETSEETILLTNGMVGDAFTENPETVLNSMEDRQVSQTPRSPPPLMQYLQYVVPTMLVLLTLRYEAKPEALFGKHRVPLRCFIATTSIYWLTAGVMKKMALTTKARKMCYDLVLSRIALASGIQSVLFLLSMFMNHVPPTIISLLISAPIALLIAYLFIKMVFGAGERNYSNEGLKDKIADGEHVKVACVDEEDADCGMEEQLAEDADYGMEEVEKEDCAMEEVEIFCGIEAGPSQ